MTWVGLDVHARSTHAAAIDVVSGELTRARFGAGSEEVVDWLSGLRAPARVVYEAGPTGFALYRAARAAGIAVEVIAPSKTARPSGERVKNDRKDAELLARLAMAGQLTAVAVPSEFVEAARHLSRTREQVRGDLMAARQRVSKLLLAHGRVYEGTTTWNKAHRSWLGGQRFEQAPTELAFVDLLAAVDGLVARKDALDERLSRLATDERLWSTVARLRAFRGIDTLTALALHLELGGDWQRFSSPCKLFSWLGLTPSLDQSGQSTTQGSITKTGSDLRPPAAGRGRLALRPPAADRRHPAQPPGRPERPRAADRLARPAPPAPPPRPPARTRQAAHRRDRRDRARAGRVPVGRRHRAMT